MIMVITVKNTDYILDGKIIAELELEDETFDIEVKCIKDKFVKRRVMLLIGRTEQCFIK